MRRIGWRKSSYSGGDNGSNCVEVACTSTVRLIRDSKAPHAGMLNVPATALAALLRSVSA